MTENHLRWFGHVQRRPQEEPVRRVDNMIFSQDKKEKRETEKEIGGNHQGRP